MDAATVTSVTGALTAGLGDAADTAVSFVTAGLPIGLSVLGITVGVPLAVRFVKRLIKG